jgi:hypothetical protein
MYCTNRSENISFISIEGFHLLGEQRYTANGTLVAAHGCVAYKDVGEGRELGAVSFTTPWNRITIPRRCALPCTTTSAPFTVFN